MEFGKDISPIGHMSEYEFKTVQLQFLKASVTKILSPSMAATAQIYSEIVPQMLDAMAFELKAHVQAVQVGTKQYSKTVEFEYHTPTSWWQMFKRDVLRPRLRWRWMRRLVRPVKEQKHIIARQVHYYIDAYAAYPDSEFTVMPKEFGKPYPLFMGRPQ